MKPSNLLRIASWGAVIVWALTIIVLSSLSGPQVAKMNVFKIWDKAAHFIAFLVGALLLANALRLSTHLSWTKIVIVAAVAMSLYGASDEIHQLCTPKRSGADLGDWIADSLGAIAGSLLIFIIYARFKRKSCPSPSGN